VPHRGGLAAGCCQLHHQWRWLSQQPHQAGAPASCAFHLPNPRSQGLDSPRPTRGYLATSAQVHQLAAHHAHTPARLDAVSAQAAARHSTDQPRPGGDQPPSPSGGGHANPVPPGLGGWVAGEAGDSDPEVARLLAVLANAGLAGLTVTELVVASGRQKTWVYDRLGDLHQADTVERAGQGCYRLAQHPMRGRGAVS
jgi:hypothetical protein